MARMTTVRKGRSTANFGGHVKKNYDWATRGYYPPITRITRKVQRNEKCPCGSKKKFKHCCIDEL